MDIAPKEPKNLSTLEKIFWILFIVAILIFSHVQRVKAQPNLGYSKTELKESFKNVENPDSIIELKNNITTTILIPSTNLTRKWVLEKDVVINYYIIFKEYDLYLQFTNRLDSILTRSSTTHKWYYENITIQGYSYRDRYSLIYSYD